ncbi:MAG: alpha/beta hydrolase [Euryarchaeota archaeon]|nr:alpha/beta hydrolase [Euryarchaeota archaeon]
MQNGANSEHAEVDGTWQHWYESGEGEKDVILIHGIPTTPHLWRYVVPRLRGAKVHNWEMVGFGDSIPEGEGRDIGVARQAVHLHAWMDHMGIERAVLAGHDLGGGVAQILAARHPERCSGLFLTNSIGYDSWPIPSVDAMRAMRPLVRRTPETLFRRVHATFIRRGHDDADRAKESHRIHFRPYHEHGGAEAFAHQIDDLDTDDTLAVQHRIPRLDVPARVVWGAADRYQKVAYGERLAADLGVILERIEEGRHFTPEDHPEPVAAAINDIVARAF